MTDRPVSAAASFPWLEPVLAVLCAWAGVEAVLAWWRQPPPPPPLPNRIQLEGRWFQREPKLPHIPSLPSGVVVRRAADYQASNGQRLALRWLVNESSGSGVRLEPEKLSPVLLGSGRLGVCRVTNANTSSLLGTGRTGPEIKALLALNKPHGLQQMEWVLGLRPWMQNRCLFVGRLP